MMEVRVNCGSRNREIRVFSDVLLLLLYYARKMCFPGACLKGGVTGSSYELTTVIFTHPEKNRATQQSMLACSFQQS